MARYAVIGLGRFGMTVAKILAENGKEIIAIDKNQDLVDEVSGLVSVAVCVDSTDVTALRSQNLNETDAVIIGIGSNIQESILTAAILRKIGVGVIIAKVESELHGRILSMIGVQQVLLPEEVIGKQLAMRLISRNILEYTDISSEHLLTRLIAPSEFVGKSLQELALPASRGVNVVAIRYNFLSVTEDGRNVIEKKLNDMPGANDIINEGDELILLGARGNIDKLILELDTKKE